MQVDAYLVDWKEALRRFKDDTLLDDFSAALEDGAKWLKPAKLWTDSQSYCDVIIEVFETTEKKLPPGLRKAFKGSFGQFISYDDTIHDLGDDGEAFAYSISPASAAKMAKLASTIDYGVFAKTFYATASDDAKQELADFWKEGAKPERAFERVVIPYLQMWQDVLNRAAKEQRGILIDYN